jgi:hypothetical protein
MAVFSLGIFLLIRHEEVVRIRRYSMLIGTITLKRRSAHHKAALLLDRDLGGINRNEVHNLRFTRSYSNSLRHFIPEPSSLLHRKDIMPL